VGRIGEVIWVFDFVIDNKGKTSGSRVLFVKGADTHAAHKPHPSNVLKGYVVKQAYDYLKEKGFL
jgi:hypothetical protein